MRFLNGPRVVAALTFALLIAGCAFAQTPAGPAPDDDPGNVLLMKLKDGVVVIRMRPDLAPNHVARIKELARAKFYDGVPFHRVISGELAQTGDPTGTGAGGSGRTLKAEFSDEHHVRGTVSMARGDDEDSADSQWFICLRPMPDLDHHYTIWGKVIRGMEFVNHITPGLEEEDGRVIDPDRIVSLRVEADLYKRGPNVSKGGPNVSKGGH
jgi:peptidylprolyl isomerase